MIHDELLTQFSSLWLKIELMTWILGLDLALMKVYMCSRNPYGGASL